MSARLYIGYTNEFGEMGDIPVVLFGNPDKTDSFIFAFDATGNVTLSLFAALLVGLFAGFMNGVIVVYFGIPSLVATIGTQFFWRGAVLVLSQGKSGSLVETKDSFVHTLLVGKIGDYLPHQMLWLVVIAIATWILLNRHKLGAHIYLIGDNEEKPP